MDLKAIVDKNYPNCMGAMVTGSQLRPGYNRFQSDLDLIIFDSFFSVVSTFAVFQEGHKIDFTQVPINDIDNVIRNEQFDQRGILLTMIATGEIIKDNKYGVVEGIRNRAGELFNKGIHDNLPVYMSMIKALTKIRKDFNKDVREYQKMFLINDFFFNITQAELIKLSKWRFTGKHKANLLYELNPRFVSEVQELAMSSMRTDDLEPFRAIGNYIDEYLTHKAMSNGERLFDNDHLWIDIDYKGISIKHFTSTVLPAIAQSPELKERYLHFFLSPTSLHRIYRNRLCICFENNGLQNNELITIVEKLFNDTIHKPYRFSITPTYSLNEQIPKNTFIKQFLDCAVEASLLMERLIGSFEEFNAERSLIMALITNSFLLTYLDIKEFDAIRLLYYLSSRYITNRQEQEGRPPDDLNRFRIDRYNQFHKYFAGKRELFVTAFNKGRSLSEKIHIEDAKLYIPLVMKLRTFIDGHWDNNVLMESQTLTRSLLSHLISNSDLDNCVLFILVFEQLQQSFLLDTHQTALQLTILSECLKPPVL